jgi:hypothetical protein
MYKNLFNVPLPMMMLMMMMMMPMIWYPVSMKINNNTIGKG